MSQAPFRCNLVIEVLSVAPGLAAIPQAVGLYRSVLALTQGPLGDCIAEVRIAEISTEAHDALPVPSPRRRGAGQYKAKAKKLRAAGRRQSAEKPKAKVKAKSAVARQQSAAPKPKAARPRKARPTPVQDAIKAALADQTVGRTANWIIDHLVETDSPIAHGIARDVLEMRVGRTVYKMSGQGSLRKLPGYGAGYVLADAPAWPPPSPPDPQSSAPSFARDTSDFALLAAIRCELKADTPISLGMLLSRLIADGWPDTTASLRARVGPMVMDAVADGSMLMNDEGFRLAP